MNIFPVPRVRRSRHVIALVVCTALAKVPLASSAVEIYPDPVGGAPRAADAAGEDSLGQTLAPPSASAGEEAPRLQAPHLIRKKTDSRLSAEVFERMHVEAEGLYHQGRWSAALDAFQEIVSADSTNAAAWLRIGNLQQRRRQLTTAASAYRRAASEASRNEARNVPDVRGRALINLALVNLELAEAALAAYDREASLSGGASVAPATAPARASIVRELQAASARARTAQRALPEDEAPRKAQPEIPRLPVADQTTPKIEYLKGAPSP